MLCEPPPPLHHFGCDLQHMVGFYALHRLCYDRWCFWSSVRIRRFRFAGDSPTPRPPMEWRVRRSYSSGHGVTSLRDRARLEPAARTVRLAGSCPARGGRRTRCGRTGDRGPFRDHRDRAARTLGAPLCQCRDRRPHGARSVGPARSAQTDRSRLRPPTRTSLGKPGARPGYIAVVGRMLAPNARSGAARAASRNGATGLRAAAAGAGGAILAHRPFRPQRPPCAPPPSPTFGLTRTRAAHREAPSVGP